MSDLEFFEAEAPDDMFVAHQESCVFCGSNTSENGTTSVERTGESCPIVKCESCGVQVSHLRGTVRLWAEPSQVDENMPAEFANLGWK